MVDVLDETIRSDVGDEKFQLMPFTITFSKNRIIMFPTVPDTEIFSAWNIEVPSKIGFERSEHRSRLAFTVSDGTSNSIKPNQPEYIPILLSNIPVGWDIRLSFTEGSRIAIISFSTNEFLGRGTATTAFR